MLIFATASFLNKKWGNHIGLSGFLALLIIWVVALMNPVLADFLGQRLELFTLCWAILDMVIFFLLAWLIKPTSLGQA
jgi:hypothetical protein